LTKYPDLCYYEGVERRILKLKKDWIYALKTMGHKKYWNKPNTVEFFAFMIKLLIIFPGLIFGIQWWWLYVFALFSSIALVWSSTKKTLPSIIIFNIGWTVLAIVAIVKHWI
jgi:hypothetical protein